MNATASWGPQAGNLEVLSCPHHLRNLAALSEERTLAELLVPVSTRQLSVTN